MLRVIIMCAGKGERWNNYLDRPKQLVDIDGETLLYRTIRLLNERGIRDIIVTVPEIGYFGDIHRKAKEMLGRDTIEIDKFLNAEAAFREPTIFLWGDVYFTEEALDTIIADNNDIMFFGRENGSEITGKEWGELFAVKANRWLLDKAKELRDMADTMDRCASWELYRYINGTPLEEHIISGYFTEINDRTEDFDYPIDYEKWRGLA